MTRREPLGAVDEGGATVFPAFVDGHVEQPEDQPELELGSSPSSAASASAAARYLGSSVADLPVEADLAAREAERGLAEESGVAAHARGIGGRGVGDPGATQVDREDPLVAEREQQAPAVWVALGNERERLVEMCRGGLVVVALRRSRGGGAVRGDRRRRPGDRRG